MAQLTIGYALGGFFFLGSSTWMLKRINKLTSEKILCKEHVLIGISPIILFNIGMAMIVVFSSGLIYESTCVGDFHSLLSHPLPHQTFYMSCIVVGACTVLESKRKLPLDFGRMVWAMALFLQFMKLIIHYGQRQNEESSNDDAKLHRYLAYISLANAAAVAYSIRKPMNVEVYIASWVILCLHGTWMITLVFFRYFVDKSAFRVDAIDACLGLEIVTITSVFMSTAKILFNFVESTSNSKNNHLMKESKEERRVLSLSQSSNISYTDNVPLTEITIPGITAVSEMR